MLYCKKNVRFGKFDKIGIMVLDTLCDISVGIEKDMWITSANDSKHRKLSKHFKDKAYDIRTRHLTFEEFDTLSWQIATNVRRTELILFEWRENRSGNWIKHKANFTKVGYINEFKKYLNCKNKKVSHLHIEW